MAKKVTKDGIEFIESTEDDGIDHVSVVEKNELVEKKKKEARKKAEELRQNTSYTEPIITTNSGEVKYTSELTFQERIDEITRCTIDPIYFIENYFTIFDQTQGDEGEIVPFRLFDFQKELIENFRNHKLNIANKYRQAGISTATSAYIAWYIAFNENRTVAIVADKMETAVSEMMKDVVDFLDNCPDWLVPHPNEKDNEKHKIYSNKSEIKAFAPTSLRGYTPTLLFWDETAWADKGVKFWTAARPAALNTGGRAIFVSTPNGLDPIFYKTFTTARKGKSKFNAVELWWFNDPRYNGESHGKLDLEWIKNKGKKNEIRMKDEGWSKEKRIELHDNGWEATSSWFEDQILEYNGDTRKLAQELLCSFLGSGDNFISEEYIKRIEEEEVKTPLAQEYVDNNFWIWEQVIPGVQYIQTIDVSAGHGEDYSTINIYRIEEHVEERTITKNGVQKQVKVRRHRAIQVAEYYSKIRPNILGDIAYQYGKRYNDAYTIIDVSNGYGVITLEKMMEHGYENIHHGEMSNKPMRDRLNGYIKTAQKTLPDGKITNVDLIPGFYIGGNRASVLIEFQRSINMEDIVIRSHRLLEELKTFVTVPGNRVADHKRSFHDDSIMGSAIGVYCLFHELFKVGESKSKTKKMLDSITKINHSNTQENEQQIDNKKINAKTPVTKPDPIYNNNNNRRNPYGQHAWLMKSFRK